MTSTPAGTRTTPARRLTVRDAAILAVALVLHAGSWNVAHVVAVVLPLGALLGLLYVWRRNIVVVVIAHLVTDLPLVVLAVR